MIAARRCAARAARFDSGAILPVCVDVAAALLAADRVLPDLAVAIFRGFDFTAFMKRI
jgi:hypothetical protein